MGIKAINHSDVIIIGAGLSGLTLALALQKIGLKIILIDKTHPTFKTESITDLRSLALSYTSKQIYSALDIWPQLACHSTVIKKIHISDRGHFGFARLQAEQLQTSALGYVIPIQSLTAILLAKIQSAQMLHLGVVDSIEMLPEFVEILINHEDSFEKMRAQLLIAADGSCSQIRDDYAIGTLIQDYGQTALVVNVGLERGHKNTAYERFTADGPLALLPLQEKTCALVWCLNPEDVNKISTLADDDFIAKLQKVFGYRLGRFAWVGHRQTYPLKQIQAKQRIAERMVLVGNASQTLHPIAGQGFNLGLRDVALLAELIEDFHQNQKDLGTYELLQTYVKMRQKDQQFMLRFTDNLVRIFSNGFLPFILLRNLGLVGFDRLLGKDYLSCKTMGYSDPIPDLARK